MQTFIGWVDLSEADEKRARDYLRSLEEGTIDELGFGVLRDTFAEIFFPATNTIMTRARYFVFVPAICITVERMRLHGDQANRKCTNIELELRGKLPIARRKPTVERYPSSIYWNALKQLGVFKIGDWSQPYYFAHLKEYQDNRRTSTDDDGSVHLSGERYEHWDEEFIELFHNGNIGKPDSKGRFPGDVNINLTHDEATYLSRRFQNIGDGRAEHDSIIAHLLRRRINGEFNYPWECACPRHLKEAVHHSEMLSAAAKGATLLYYLMLDERRGELGFSSGSVDYEHIISLWWSAIRDRLCDWDLNGFIDLATEHDALRRNDDTFFRGWLQRLRNAPSASSFYRDPVARSLIRERELVKRPRKSRLRGGRYLERWKFPGKETQAEYSDAVHVRYQLDYRAWIGQRFVDEINSALESEG